MTLRSLTDDGLILKTRTMLANERALRTEVIRCLAEIERRRLYAERGYSSLFEFCVKELGLSEASAYRRIAAARLMREVPEVESKIKNGTLSLSAVTQVYSTVQKLKKNQSREMLTAIKQELLEKFENTSARERDEQLAEMFPGVSFIKERIKPISPERVEIKLTVSRQLAQKIERLQEVMAHQNRGGTIEGLLEKLVEMGLKKSDPLYSKSPHARPQISLVQ